MEHDRKWQSGGYFTHFNSHCHISRRNVKMTSTMMISMAATKRGMCFPVPYSAVWSRRQTGNSWLWLEYCNQNHTLHWNRLLLQTLNCMIWSSSQFRSDTYTTLAICTNLQNSCAYTCEISEVKAILHTHNKFKIKQDSWHWYHWVDFLIGSQLVLVFACIQYVDKLRDWQHNTIYL